MPGRGGAGTLWLNLLIKKCNTSVMFRQMAVLATVCYIEEGAVSSEGSDSNSSGILGLKVKMVD